MKTTLAVSFERGISIRAMTLHNIRETICVKNPLQCQRIRSVYLGFCSNPGGWWPVAWQDVQQAALEGLGILGRVRCHRLGGVHELHQRYALRLSGFPAKQCGRAFPRC